MKKLARNYNYYIGITLMMFITVSFAPKNLQSTAFISEERASVDSNFNTVNWNDFTKTEALSKTNKKKILVSLYTDWCGWCKKMDKETFTDKRIIASVNNDFYPIKFNAEQKGTVLFMEREFKYMAQYKTHEIAIALTGGELSYPSTIILDENFEFIDRIPGYVSADAMADILEFYGKDIYKTTKWDVYKKSKLTKN